MSTSAIFHISGSDDLRIFRGPNWKATMAARSGSTDSVASSVFILRLNTVQQRDRMRSLQEALLGQSFKHLNKVSHSDGRGCPVIPGGSASYSSSIPTCSRSNCEHLLGPIHTPQASWQWLLGRYGMSDAFQTLRRGWGRSCSNHKGEADIDPREGGDSGGVSYWASCCLNTPDPTRPSEILTCSNLTPVSEEYALSTGPSNPVFCCAPHKILTCERLGGCVGTFKPAE